MLIVIAANVAALAVYRRPARVTAALTGGDPGPAGHVVHFIGIARIVLALRHLARTLLLRFAAMPQVIIFVLQAETLVRRCRRGQRKQQ